VVPEPLVEACEETSYLLQPEDALSGAVEDAGELEPEFQARDVAVAFYRVDALAGDTHQLGELFLRPSPLDPEFLDPVDDS